MRAPAYLSRYRETQVATATPGELVLLLYEAAVTALREARRQVEEGAPAEAHKALIKAQRVVGELLDALKPDQGGSLAQDLGDIYRFVLRHLAEANLRKDPEMVAEALELLAPLRDAWLQIVRPPSAAAAPGD